MCEPAFRRCQAPASSLGLDALAGKVAVGGIVNELFAGRDARQNFYEIALGRAEGEISELRNSLAVENVYTGQRAAGNDSGMRNDYRLPDAVGKLRCSVHAGAQLA